MQFKIKNKFYTWYRIISIVFYIFSLTQMAFTVTNDDYYGIEVLFWGIFYIFKGGSHLIWLANPIIWYAWFNIDNVQKSLVASGISTFVSFSFLFFSKITTECSGDLTYIECELGIVSYGIGYVFWTLSSVILLVGCYARKVKEAKHQNEVSLKK